MTSSLRAALAALSIAAAACGTTGADKQQSAGTTGSGGSGGSGGTTGTTGSGGSGGAGGSPPADQYSAAAMFTDVPRFTLLKMSKARSLCFRLRAVADQGSGMSYSIESAEVTNDPDDCVFTPGPPPAPVGAVVSTMSFMGTISVAFAGVSCTTDASVQIEFPPGGPSWVPASESFSATGLTIQGGCP